MKNILNFLILIIFGVLLFVFMQLSLVFLKDRVSSIKIEEPEYILALLNRSERDILLSEKEKLLKQLRLTESEARKSKISKEDRENINRKLIELKSKVSENNKKIDKNTKESKLFVADELNKSLKTKNKQMLDELMKKNDDVNRLNIKIEKIEKENKDNSDNLKIVSDAIKDKLLTTYKDDKEKLKTINKSLKGENPIEFMVSELANISGVGEVKGDDESAKKINEIEKKHKALILQKDKEIARLKKQQTAVAPVTANGEDLSKGIRNLEVVIETNYKNYADIMSEYNTAKKSFKSSGNVQMYLFSLASVYTKCVALDKQSIADRDRKNAKNAAEIMRLLKTIDELKK